MFFNKSLLSFVFVMLLVAGLTFVAIPATAAVTPALSVTDADDVTPGIQVYGIRAEDVSFQLTVTFQDTANSNANTQVTGFDVNDIVLYPADSSNNIIPGGATAVPVSPNANSSVYTTTITVKGNISKVIVQVPAAAAQTLPTIGQNDQVTPGRDTAAGTPANLVVNIVRSAAPPLTISADTSISGQAPFTVTLTSTKAITLTHADIHVTGGDIPTNGLSSDTTRKVWTVTIRPVIDVEEVIVRPATNGAFIFPKGTFTVGPQITRQGSARALAGKVAISEIMFATNGNTNEVQWIEIFNSSQNEAVALDADRGWRLIIENYDDPGSKVARLGSINFKDDGDVKTIPPRQTVLIVSTASSTRNSDRMHFVSTRVFDVYAELASEFGMSRRADPFLHPTQGFHIELVDGRSETVDAVGNLDGRTGTSDKPAWQLPNGWVENRYRTSIIRRYRDYNPDNRRYTNKGTVHDGTKRAGWILAEKTNFTYVREEGVETWYGISSDYGTPGIHAGGALPVQLAHFRPERTQAGAVIIKWTTESEMNNAGFNILRAETKKDVFKVINAQLIPGAGTTAERNSYTWTDTTAKPNAVYYYQIEDVSFAGERQPLATSRLKGTISANGKLTTRWAGLKSQN